jgi:hypothetical protein
MVLLSQDGVAGVGMLEWTDPHGQNGPFLSVQESFVDNEPYSAAPIQGSLMLELPVSTRPAK